MQSCLILALAVLSLANAVPNDPESHAPTESKSESESDNIHLCKFLASFAEIRSGLNKFILGHNTDYMARANELTVEEAARLKGRLSEETVESEHELFADVERKTGIRQVTNLMNSLDRKFKNKYQCSI